MVVLSINNLLWIFISVIIGLRFAKRIVEPITDVIDATNSIKKGSFDLGIAFDGDGDRIGVIDDKGRVIAGDLLLLNLSKSFLRHSNNWSYH